MRINSDFMWSIYLIVVAALFFYFGNLLAVSETEERYTRESEEYTEKIRELERQNQQLSNELTSRGIFSYPQANIVSTQEDSLATILITLNGQSPLEDLTLKRTHVYNYSDINAEDAEKSGHKIRTTHLGTLKTHNPAGFEIPMKDNEVAIELNYEAGDKHWTQTMRVKKTADKGFTTFWVITNKNGEVIDKHVDKEFPTETDEGILLWKDKKVWYSKIEMNSGFKL
ncbi:hypothetical protein [Salinimicrobium soli]|uniref:hypothetical protein n=1 Tax=Salinimicrobium soli TaxID=1254399 RepID=UPI003AACD03C